MIDKWSQDPRNKSNSLPLQTVSGISWQFLSTALQISLSLIIGIILARLLTPKDFGVVGYILVFIGFSKTISQVGISPALIQLSNLTKSHLGIGLIISLIIGFVTFGLLWILSPLIVQGDSILMLRIISIIFIVNAPAIISESVLRRNLQFSHLFIVDFVSYSLGYGLVAIVLAFSHYGVWSLVIGTITQNVLRSILIIAMSPFKFSLAFTRNELSSIIRFGTGMTLARIANYGANNLDYFVTGTFLGSQALGLYQRSFQLITNSILGVTGVLTSVLFPAFSRLQDDMEKCRNLYLVSVKITALVIFPVAVLISLTSREIIIILYGEKWIGAISSLSILSINALLISILTLGDSLARGKGLVFQQFRRHFIYAIMVLSFALLGKRFYIEGVAIGVTIATFIMYFMMAKLSIEIINAKWKDFFYAQFLGFFVSIIMVIFTLLIGHIASNYSQSMLFILISKITTAGIVLLIIARFIPRAWLGEIPLYYSRYFSKRFPQSNVLIRIMRFYGFK